MTDQPHKPHPPSVSGLEGYPKIDRRYRESKYFLMDQLRYADSVQDFRTVKQAILRSTQFSIAHRAFHFAKIPLPAEDKK